MVTHWDQVKSACLNFVNAIVQFFTNLWTSITTTVTNIWTAITTTFTNIWTTIVTIVTGIWTTIATIFTTIWTTIVTIVTGIWTTITTTFTNIWTTVTTIVTGILTGVTTTFSNMLSAIASTVGNIASTVQNGFQAAINYITSLPAQAFQWGADIISGIVQGIQSMIGSVTSAVSSVASSIKSVIGFSEPETGPLSDFHTYMPDMMELMASGISKNKDKVLGALNGLASGMSVAASANVISSDTLALAGGYSGTGSRTITQNVNISNQFNGDRAGQQKAATAMDKASTDATSQMARALAFAR